ncbi:MAG: hypothetical protein GY745_21340 [Actinomycetia bacterium]|nr:hypothetical protein [Actinomycetes bacterium]
MGQRYFKSRTEAGQLALNSFGQFSGKNNTIIALDTDSLIIGAQLSQYLQSPLQLYLSNEIEVPGGLKIGGVNTEGGFSYNSSMAESETDYVYQEFHGYIEESKRTNLSQLNRELGDKTVIRRDLIRNRNIIFVADAMTDTIMLDSALEYIKSVAYKSVAMCAPVVSSTVVSPLKQRTDYIYYSSTIDFFYGKDHYFEDNKVFERDEGISLVHNYLKLWPSVA